MTTDILGMVAVLAFAAGVGILFAPAATPGQPVKSWSEAAWGMLFVVALGAGAAGLIAWGHPIWAMLLAAFTAGGVAAATRDQLSDRTSGWFRFALYASAVAAAELIAYVCYHEAGDRRFAADMAEVREAQRAEFLRRREEKLSRELRALRHYWHAAPERGVGELRRGDTLIWLAVTPKVEIDNEYERSLGATARRLVPLRLVLLQDAFRPPDGVAEVGLAGWTLRIETSDGVPVAGWQREESEVAPWQPAERREFQIEWDGRDRVGALAAPGTYVAKLELRLGGEVEHLEQAFLIEDAGPLVVVEEDPVRRMIRQQQEMIRWHQMLDQGLRLLEQQRALQLQLQRWPR